ncbi:PH and SEC7 domain-containing protein isoform X5 [Schistocerca gregaria]|uniref:PH and SEC7 domain-containing protein isoform X5 n=1 Tax=Schistocerca gregaria TaxID=7010 RepID=UPI00211EA73B|nr:PH and SEC7 domain-containing protein isoform X5 [Schistocerca gregaria]
MAEELMVVLRRSDSCGLGFSLLGTAGLPPIIYDIIENSPAAESGEVEAGDVIVKVNETDVDRFSTKEVLKCLRLSADPVRLRLKRDPVIKARVRSFLAGREEPARPRPPPAAPGAASPAPAVPAAGDAASPTGAAQQRPPQPRCEAFMMTGDVILNLSRTQHSCAAAAVLPRNSHKKVDSLRQHSYPATSAADAAFHHYHHHNSVPTSPSEAELGGRHALSNSAGASPVGRRDEAAPPAAAATAYSAVRTSRSEDHLQLAKDPSLSAVDIDIDEDVTSSLNTLLDPHADSGGTPTSGGAGMASGARALSPSGTAAAAAERIVWTYNARSDSSSGEVSPNSPTSVSSSVMSSNSSNTAPTPASSLPPGGGGHGPPLNGDLSQSEAVSNISSPDFQEEETLDILSARDLMEVSDPSDSDSTLLASERNSHAMTAAETAEHRIVIQVQGPPRTNAVMDGTPATTPEFSGYQICNMQGNELRESEDELTTLSEDATALTAVTNKAVSPPLSSEDESDIESLHSFHYSPKAVDIPSAIRLAKRLYMLDGFKKSDVSRHLSKNNDFSRVVAEEYLKYFNFEGDTLDIALRKFLKQFSLTGETQERERVLVHFSKRYLDCNPGTFNSQDAVHTLTCAIMLLNTDLHGQNIGRKMTCTEFIENLSELNDGDNFPREVLKQLYQAIKSYPLEWALDDDAGSDECSLPAKQADGQHSLSASNPFLDVPNAATAVEYKKGYVMRKSCIDPNGKKTPFGKRGWKMFYCTLRDMVLYLHKDEHGFRKSALSDNLHNAIRIHHSLATKATDYTKKQHVFRLQTADQAEYLFQTSDSKELQSWIDTINFVAASFSAQPLASAVGSQRKFQRPLLPCSHTKLSLREQLRDHEERVQRLESQLEEHRRNPPDRSARGLVLHNYREKDAYLHHELKRYKTYAYLLRSRMAQFPELEATLAEATATAAGFGDVDAEESVPVVSPARSPATNSE